MFPLLLLADTPVASTAPEGAPEEPAAAEVPGAFESLVSNVVELFLAVWSIVLDLGAILWPWLPLVGWVAFWMFAVNWVRLRRIVLLEGGWIGVLLLMAVAVLVWSTIAPPVGGRHELLGLKVGNAVGKTIYVTGLVVIAFLCGSVQVSGATGAVEEFEEEDAALRAGPAGH